jgi:hypothetical protein
VLRSCCYAFGGLAGVEAANTLYTGELTTLSEQEIVDCDGLDYGCDGESRCLLGNATACDAQRGLPRAAAAARSLSVIAFLAAPPTGAQRPAHRPRCAALQAATSPTCSSGCKTTAGWTPTRTGPTRPRRLRATGGA